MFIFKNNIDWGRNIKVIETGIGLIIDKRVRYYPEIAHRKESAECNNKVIEWFVAYFLINKLYTDDNLKIKVVDRIIYSIILRTINYCIQLRYVNVFISCSSSLLFFCRENYLSYSPNLLGNLFAPLVSLSFSISIFPSATFVLSFSNPIS